MSRRFVFIDESGDPGLESQFFIVAAVDLSRLALSEWRRLISPYRHHNQLHAEMKSARMHRGKRPFAQGCELFCALLGVDGASCTVAYVDKSAYTGPYLGRAGTDVAPVKFRNFITRIVLEAHFHMRPVAGHTEIEIVFDRTSLSDEDRQNLEWYIGTNHRLPTVHDFSHVDSDYVDLVFMPDLAVTIVKDWLQDEEGPDGQTARALFHCVNATVP